MGQLIRRCSRVLVFDTVCQYGPGPRQNLLPAGFVGFSQPCDLIAYWRRYRGGPFRIHYQPGYYAEQHFEAVARLVAEVRDTVFAVDEIWHFCQPSWMPEPLKLICRAGRHRGITLLYTAQRPALVARDLRSMSTQFHIFRMTDGLDLAAMRGVIPQPALDTVPTLPDRAHVWRDEFNNWKLVRG